MKKCINKLYASSILEFLVVFLILFIFFITIIDIGLFFREVYLVQTIADETLSKLQVEHICSSDLNKVSSVMSRVVNIYYETTVEFNSNYTGGFYKFSADNEKYIFNLSCRNSSTPDSVLFGYKYNGIFLYRGGKMVFSNYSANTSYF